MFRDANGVTDWKELIEIVEFNETKATELRSAIRKLKIESRKVNDVKKAARKLETQKTGSFTSFSQDSLFEDEISFYLDDYKNLGEDFTREDLIEILPSRKNYDYQRIVMRLMSESMKEMKELHEILTKDDSLTESELLELKEMIVLEEKKRTMLREILVAKEDESLEHATKNQLILVPTSGGAIRILDEIDHIPREYYSAFLELINSIIDGTFKGVKRFTNNNMLKGLCEVKSGNGERILFTRLNRDSYAIISAFVKKTDKDKGYSDALKRKFTAYRDEEETLKDLLEDDEFLQDNDLYVQELLNLLSPINDIKKNIKGGVDSDE